MSRNAECVCLFFNFSATLSAIICLSISFHPFFSFLPSPMPSSLSSSLSSSSVSCSDSGENEYYILRYSIDFEFFNDTLKRFIILIYCTPFNPISYGGMGVRIHPDFLNMVCSKFGDILWIMVIRKISRSQGWRQILSAALG